MKLVFRFLFIGAFFVAVNAAAEPPREAPSAAIDRITLLYMNHNVYPGGAIECNSKVIGSRSMVGCWNLTLNGRSAPHIWLYEAGVFKSVNGSARQLAQGKFSREPDVAALPRPLPTDIEVAAALDSFKTR
jgi:hypothetical protein